MDLQLGPIVFLILLGLFIPIGLLSLGITTFIFNKKYSGGNIVIALVLIPVFALTYIFCLKWLTDLFPVLNNWPSTGFQIGIFLLFLSLVFPVSAFIDPKKVFYSENSK